MPRRIRRPRVPSRVVAIVQERRAAQAVEEALAQDRITEVAEQLAAQCPKDEARQGKC